MIVVAGKKENNERLQIGNALKNKLPQMKPYQD